jgi:hypothetical protein
MVEVDDSVDGDVVAQAIIDGADAPSPVFLYRQLGEYVHATTAAADAAIALHAFTTAAGGDDGEPRELLEKLEPLLQAGDDGGNDDGPPPDSFASLVQEYTAPGAEKTIVFLEDLRDIPYQVFMQARGGALQPRTQRTRWLWAAFAEVEKRRRYARDVHRRSAWVEQLLDGGVGA